MLLSTCQSFPGRVTCWKYGIVVVRQRTAGRLVSARCHNGSYLCCSEFATKLAYRACVEAYRGCIRVRSFEDMSEQHLRRFCHDGSSECVALVWTKVMTVSPPAADQLLKIGTWVDAFIVGGEVVQDFGRSMDTCRREADFSIVFY